LDVQKIRNLAIAGKYELSKHAEKERELDMITVKELEQALIHAEIIEEYPEDPRGASYLLLGFCEQRPIHAVCAINTEPEELFLITLYDPSKRPGKWTDDYRRRR